ncbi:MAG TPA: hypothetical protein PLB34_14745, partial [Rhodoblastus sp.]|nr:hypothetical protein [Rhodoblastus sp.]
RSALVSHRRTSHIPARAASSYLRDVFVDLSLICINAGCGFQFREIVTAFSAYMDRAAQRTGKFASSAL